MSIMPAMEGIANGALGGLASFVFQRRHNSRTASAARVRQIEAAAEALDRHAEGLRRLLYSKSLSNRLKLLLLDISDALEEPAPAARFVQHLAAGPRPSGSTDPVDDDFADLCATDPTMAGVFLSAFMDGLAAALLRWPDPTVQGAKILADAARLTPADLAAMVQQCFTEAPVSDLETEAA
jgi:hypothetical protein